MYCKFAQKGYVHLQAMRRGYSHLFDHKKNAELQRETDSGWVISSCCLVGSERTNEEYGESTDWVGTITFQRRQCHRPRLQRLRYMAQMHFSQHKRTVNVMQVMDACSESRTLSATRNGKPNNFGVRTLKRLITRSARLLVH